VKNVQVGTTVRCVKVLVGSQSSAAVLPWGSAVLAAMASAVSADVIHSKGSMGALVAVYASKVSMVSSALNSATVSTGRTRN